MRREWEALISDLAPDRLRAMEFLYTHLPESDLDCYPPQLFLQFADQALSLRGEAPWCAELEEEIFYHYVLFPRVNDEDLSFHRGIFFEALWPRVRDIPDAGERILEVNRWCHEQASYQLQDDRTASPLTVWRGGSGRCGEESAFLVSALRSVGIPARQVYAPRWAHCDDNHAWVEALCGGQWHFLGACEPEPVLDRGWFNTAASRAILVHSRTFGAGASPLHGPLLGQEGAVFWHNQTARYARVRTYTFRALREGQPAPGTRFQVQVLNEARFYPIANLTAGEDGCARVELGMGDFRVLAGLDGLWAQADCAGEETVLHLAPPETGNTPWHDFDMRPPQDAPVNPAPLDAAQRDARAKVLARGTELRLAKLAGFCIAGQEAQQDLLDAARGNAPVIAAFLERGGESEALLRTLTDKDLRDVTEEVLADHLEHTVPAGDIPWEIYLSYVLCPRVELEKLTPWRRELQRALTPEETATFRRDPADLWLWLEDRVTTGVERTYENLVWTPVEALKAGRCDERSFCILYTAMLRAIGVPARRRRVPSPEDHGQCPSPRQRRRDRAPLPAELVPGELERPRLVAAAPQGRRLAGRGAGPRASGEALPPDHLRAPAQRQSVRLGAGVRSEEDMERRDRPALSSLRPGGHAGVSGYAGHRRRGPGREAGGGRLPDGRSAQPSLLAGGGWGAHGACAQRAHGETAGAGGPARGADVPPPEPGERETAHPGPGAGELARHPCPPGRLGL